MKKLLLAFIALVLLLSSCSTLDSIDAHSEDEKVPYSHKESDDVYVVNKSTMAIHLPSCYIADRIKDENKWETNDLEFLIKRGYTPCKKCLNK